MNVRHLLLAMSMMLMTGGWAAAQSSSTSNLLTVEPKAERPALLVPLYLSQTLLQAADLYTTKRALAAGHVETNRVFKDASFNEMIGAKVAASAASIFIAEKIWKRNRYAAVGAMIATNVALSLVVANNYRVLQN